MDIYKYTCVMHMNIYEYIHTHLVMYRFLNDKLVVKSVIIIIST